MKISVVMPTISGREESCARMVDAYVQRTKGYELEVINPKDFPSWPAGCNAGVLRVSSAADVVHFGADDLEPLEGWADAMLETLSRGRIPAPQLWDHEKTDTPPMNASDGMPGSITAFSRVPALLHEWVDLIGPWPLMDYFADNWVSDKARSIGIETVVTAGYSFVHHWNQVGRLDKGDWVGRSIPAYNRERIKLGLPVLIPQPTKEKEFWHLELADWARRWARQDPGDDDLALLEEFDALMESEP